MKINMILFLILFISLVGVNAQSNDSLLLGLHINNTTVQLSNNRIRSLYKRKILFFDDKKLRYYHIYYYDSKKQITKNGFNDFSFIHDLKPVYHLKKKGEKKTLMTYESFITNASGKIIFYVSFNDGINVERYTSKSDSMLIDILKNKKMTLIHIQKKDFQMRSLGGPYLGILDNQIFGITRTLDGLKIFDKNELMKNHWEDFFGEGF